MNPRRILRHMLATRWATRRRFTPAVLDGIEAAIEAAETRHAGEIRFAVETAIDLPSLWRGETARARALEAFAGLGVWDTEANNGVLIYVLMADHDFEIIADRGIASRVSQAEWEEVCREAEDRFRAGRFGEGAQAAIAGVARLLGRHFPARGADRNEQPNQPVLL
jgi:uncharacterized membrane protein YgcG